MIAGPTPPIRLSDCTLTQIARRGCRGGPIPSIRRNAVPETHGNRGGPPKQTLSLSLSL